MTSQKMTLTDSKWKVFSMTDSHFISKKEHLLHVETKGRFFACTLASFEIKAPRRCKRPKGTKGLTRNIKNHFSRFQKCHHLDPRLHDHAQYELINLSTKRELKSSRLQIP